MRGGVEEGKYNRRHYFLLKLYRMLAWRARKFTAVIVTTCHCNNPLLLDAIYALTAARALLRGWIYSLERLVSVSLVAIIGYERLFVALSKDRRISERELRDWDIKISISTTLWFLSPRRNHRRGHFTIFRCCSAEKLTICGCYDVLLSSSLSALHY